MRFRSDGAVTLVPLRCGAQTEPSAADIAPPRRRIDGEVHRRAQIAATVVGVLWMERQPREIDIAARKHNLVDRRVARGDLDERLPSGESCKIGVVKLVLCGVEGGGQTPTVAGGLGDQLDMFGAGLFEQHRLRGCLDNRAEPGQWHRLVMHLRGHRAREVDRQEPDSDNAHLACRSPLPRGDRRALSDVHDDQIHQGGDVPAYRHLDP
jgi:hypothetical protein